MPKERQTLTPEELFKVNKIYQVIKDEVCAEDTCADVGGCCTLDDNSVHDAALAIFNTLEELK